MTRGTRSRRLFNIHLCTVATNGVFVRGPRFSRWHTNEEDFRGHHLLLSGHARQIFAMTDDVAERMRKIGRTLHKRQQCLKNSNEESVAPDDDE
jgi:DNA-binding ferritin-like protein